MLKIEPVRRAGALRYPAKDAALAHPELLERLPARWRACRQVVAAAGMLVAVVVSSGCRDSDGVVMYAGAPTPPPVLGEAEAMVVFERIMKEYLPNVSCNVEVNRSNQSIVYYLKDYSSETKKYLQTESVTAGSIDLYDEQTCIGLEYIGADDRVEGVLQEGAAKPEQSKPNVLIVDGIYEGTAESDIRAMIVDFLTWLKAEGIG